MARKFKVAFTFLHIVFLPLLTNAVTTLASFAAGNGGWHMGTLAVGNLDADPGLEIVIPYRDVAGQWHLDAFDWNGAHLSGFPYNSGLEEMNTSPTLYDLDNDGRMEILFMRGNKIVALRGNGSVVWTNAITYQNYIPQSGFQVVTNGFYWSGDGQFKSTLPSDAVFSSQFSSPVVADFDGNGTRLVATASKIDPEPGNQQDYNPFINDIFGLGEWGTVGEVWSGGVVFFNAQTGAKDFVYHLHTLVEAGIGVGQADKDAPLEVYVLNDSDSVVAFDKTKPYGFYGNGQLHGMFGKNLRMTTGFYKQGIDVYPADIDGDGLDELLSVTTQFNALWQPHESVLDDDGALMWRQWKQPVNVVNNSGWFNNAGMFAVNPDHDNRADVLSFTHAFEINFREWDGVNLVNRPGWPKNFGTFLPTPPVVGDIDGDGQEEIIIGTHEPSLTPSSGALYIFSLSGALEQSLIVPGGLKHIPFLADVNGDNSVDVVYRSLNGQVYVQNFGAMSASNVSWATHRGNAQRDGYRGRSLFPPNTPRITKKVSGSSKTYFEWNTVTNATAYRVYRANGPEEAFTFLESVPGTRTNHTDVGLAQGWQYFYELAAIVNGAEVRSSPFAILSLYNSNLVTNAGMEENDNSHWDKWDTGDIPWTNMIGSTNAYQGRQSMQIILQNNTTTDSINQYAMYATPRAYLPVTAGTLYSFGGFFKSGGLTTPTTHWFEWTSSLTGENYGPRPSFPYPNYFTPQYEIGTGATPWTYLNRVFVMPAGFPNVELRHRFIASSPASGSVFLDNLFFRALPPVNSPSWSNLVPFGSTWKYLMVPAPPNWYATNFNDTLWLQGQAKFGAGSGPTNVTTPLLPAQPAYYFRKNFVVTQPRLEEFLLAATCTDDYGGVIYPLRLWLNGQAVVASGIEAVSFDGNLVKYFDLTPFQHLLKSGTNLVAVQVSNTFQLTWDNVAFDVNLKGVPAPVIAPRFLAIRHNGTTVDMQITAPIGSSVRVESRDSFSTPWQLVETRNNISTSPFWVTDTGQNGRLPPSSVPHRFYRIVLL